MKAGGNSHSDDYPILPGCGGSGGSSYSGKPDGHAITVSRPFYRLVPDGTPCITIHETFAISDLPAKQIVAIGKEQYLVTVERITEKNGIKHDSIVIDELT